MSGMDEFEREWRQRTEDLTRYLVSGLIVNDPQGPKRFFNWYEATSPRMAEDLARADIRSEEVDGMRGELWVANVFRLSYDADDNPFIEQVDTYATYTDPDGARPEPWFALMRYWRR
jgi:hypothetical protein